MRVPVISCSMAIVIAAFLLSAPHVGARDRGGLGASIGGSNGVSASVGRSSNGSGLGASVAAGGSRGVNADADVSSSRSGGLGAAVGASVGGTSGVNANVTAGVGGTGGANANVNAAIGATTADIGVGIGGNIAPSPVSPGSRIDAAVLQNFNSLSASDRQKLLVKCRDVTAGGYDAALASLCKLLQTASR